MVVGGLDLGCFTIVWVGWFVWWGFVLVFICFVYGFELWVVWGFGVWFVWGLGTCLVSFVVGGFWVGILGFCGLGGVGIIRILGLLFFDLRGLVFGFGLVF